MFLLWVQCMGVELFRGNIDKKKTKTADNASSVYFSWQSGKDNPDCSHTVTLYGAFSILVLGN